MVGRWRPNEPSTASPLASVSMNSLSLLGGLAASADATPAVGTDRGAFDFRRLIRAFCIDFAPALGNNPVDKRTSVRLSNKIESAVKTANTPSLPFPGRGDPCGRRVAGGCGTQTGRPPGSPLPGQGREGDPHLEPVGEDHMSAHQRP